MCEETTKMGNKCRSPNKEGTQYCSRHQKTTSRTKASKSGCTNCGKTHKSTKDDATCSRTNQKIAGVFCEKNDTGEKVCKFEVKEGKICGKSTRKSDHPYCARHGQKTTELIPIYDVSSSPCSFVNCTQVALSGTNLCSMHTGICPFNGCGLKVLGATGMCAQRHVLGVQRCRCGGCTEPAMSDGLCVYHLAKGCNERWNWFKRNMERMTATQSKTMANNCGSNCCGSTKGGKCKFAACNPGTCDVDGQRLTNAKAAAKRAGNKSAQAKLGKMKCDNCGIMM